MKSFELTEVFPVKPLELYSAWLDSKTHGKMTESPATINPEKNGEFNVWDGYITGKNIELIPGKKIVQEWRTTDFKENDKSSILELIFHTEGQGTRLTLKHSAIPSHLEDDFETGWKDFYFKPMKAYFK